MIVRTFTHAWNMRVRIYAFDDIRLPVKNGISVPQVIAGAVAAVLWIPFCLLIGLPPLAGNVGVGIMIMAVPPVLVLLYSDRPVAYEKSVEEWVTSWGTRRVEPRRLAAMGSSPPPRVIKLTAARWIPAEPIGGEDT